MCTLAWGQSNGQLWVCFNRDEQITRPQAEPPGIFGNPGEQVVYARDPVGKGSWFIAAEYGYVVALLNHYPEIVGHQKEMYRSRGQLVLELARKQDLHAADSWLTKVSLGIYRSFDLFLLSPDRVIARSWDGSNLSQLTCPYKFWTTSAHMQESVRSWRTSWWQEQIQGRELDADIAGTIMQCHCKEKPEYGVTMNRDSARTVSQIRLQMDKSGFVFHYYSRSFSGRGFLPRLVLKCPR